jgi:hypothetical protein
VTRAARFAAVLSTMHAAHNLADHVLQTDAQALGKAGPGADGWRAMAGHVGSYHAAQVAALATADRTLGLGLRPGRVAVAVAFSAGTHAFLDRRWPVKRALELTGSPGFATGRFEIPRTTITAPVPLHGPYLADQALHHACLWVAALIATGGSA